MTPEGWIQLITEAYWPLVALVAVLVLRRKIKNFAFEYGDKKLSLELDQVAKLAHRIEEKFADAGASDAQNPIGTEHYVAIERAPEVLVPPREAIDTIYTAVRHALEAKMDDAEVGRLVGWSPRDIAAILAYRGLIDSSVYDGILGLQRLYTMTMDETTKVGQDSVQSFKRLASSILRGLEAPGPAV